MKKKSWRTDAFDLWCCRRLLRVPWTAKRSNQSILKEVNPNIHWKDCGWSWNSNTLAIWCEELTHWKRPWCWERLKAKGEGARWLASITDSMNMNLSKLKEIVEDRGGWRAAVHEVEKSRMQLSGWTTATTRWGTNWAGGKEGEGNPERGTFKPSFILSLSC